MASLCEIMSEQEKTNWLKAWLALNITKIGLHDFVDREVQHFQNSILQSSNLGFSANPTCKKCYTANLLPCPTQGICKKGGRNPVCKSMHDTPGKQYRPCPNGICDNVRDAIIKAHRFAGPSWKNTEADQWACNHWELGKCYMPPDGYISVKSIHDTDFNGVISVMLNCTHFDNKMSFSIARPQPGSPCLLTKVKTLH
ncbi:hypothetical protein DPMN_136601 [Dreissena polymorpha]|uniref:Uncharacterized protein n=1 Tax=Dreissena polymorpha TaxID=45954 RepID=A0A9D4JGV8_DREPO|nr:hypothetical protein DPMN_136601 [Dreissena polymorpha]